MTDQKKDFYDVLRDIVELLKPLQKDEQIKAVRWACEQLEINITNSGNLPNMLPKTSQIISSSLNQQNIQQNAPKNIKTFIDEKKPIADNHLAAAIAYYYQFEATEKKESISKNDLVEAARQIGQGGRFKRPDQTLVNATSAGYLDNVSRGLYKLNSVGENFVVMSLPTTENTNSIAKKRKKKAKKTTKNRSKKK